MRRLTQEEFLTKCHACHGDRYDYSQAHYVNGRTKIVIICRKHGPFSQQAQSHYRGHGCPVCAQEEYWASPVGQRHKCRLQDGSLAKMGQVVCMKKYDAPSFISSKAGHAVIDAKKRTPEYRQKMSKIISSDAVQQKTKQTCRVRYDRDSFMQTDEGRSMMSFAMRSGSYEKQIATKRKNGTFTTSKYAEATYGLLCDYFGKSNVVREYKSIVYPFHCDFYIKSRDLYIESNISWTHGGHWFDSMNPSDVNMFDFYAQCDGDYYRNAIDVWTRRDVIKRQTARDNQLKYVVFWDPKLNDVRSWLNAGAPDCYDWM